MSKTITKTRNVASFQDTQESNDEDEEIYKMMLTEIDELNNKLNEERLSNEKNESYILVLEEELKETYEKYKKLKDDIKHLEDYKQISKMTNEKIKETIKQKMNVSTKDKYKKMDINELRKIANDRLKTLKSKYNIVD
jgi:hypothetical protein